MSRFTPFKDYKPDDVKRELKESLFIFIGGGLLQVLFLCGSCHDSLFLLGINFLYSGIFWVLLSKGSQYLVSVLDMYYPWLKYPVYRTIISVICVVVYTFIVIWGIDLFFDLIVFGRTLEEAIKEPSASVTSVILVTLAINLFMHGRGFLLDWRQVSIDNERLKTEQVASQYNSLKNQVNPHFLFNSLNVLSSLVYDDQGKAVEFIRKLSQVYRYVLDSKDEEVVPVKDEMEFVQNFAFLQKIRFGENLVIKIHENGSDKLVPPLAIQVLVENAIKHNVVSEKDPLTIKVEIKDESCVVWNNLKEKKVKDSTGIGLENLIARYTYLTNREVEVQKGVDFFEVRLPLLTMKS